MNAEVQSNRKAELLSSTVEHVAIDQYDARPIIDARGGEHLGVAPADPAQGEHHHARHQGAKDDPGRFHVGLSPVRLPSQKG